MGIGDRDVLGRGARVVADVQAVGDRASELGRQRRTQTVNTIRQRRRTRTVRTGHNRLHDLQHRIRLGRGADECLVGVIGNRTVRARTADCGSVDVRRCGVDHEVKRAGRFGADGEITDRTIEAGRSLWIRDQDIGGVGARRVAHGQAVGDGVVELDRQRRAETLDAVIERGGTGAARSSNNRLDDLEDRIGLWRRVDHGLVAIRRDRTIRAGAVHGGRIQCRGRCVNEDVVAQRAFFADRDRAQVAVEASRSLRVGDDHVGRSRAALVRDRDAVGDGLAVEHGQRSASADDAVGECGADTVRAGDDSLDDCKRWIRQGRDVDQGIVAVRSDGAVRTNTGHRCGVQGRGYQRDGYVEAQRSRVIARQEQTEVAVEISGSLGIGDDHVGCIARTSVADRQAVGDGVTFVDDEGRADAVDAAVEVRTGAVWTGDDRLNQRQLRLGQEANADDCRVAYRRQRSVRTEADRRRRIRARRVQIDLHVIGERLLGLAGQCSDGNVAVRVLGVRDHDVGGIERAGVRHADAVGHGVLIDDVEHRTVADDAAREVRAGAVRAFDHGLDDVETSGRAREDHFGDVVDAADTVVVAGSRVVAVIGLVADFDVGGACRHGRLVQVGVASRAIVPGVLVQVGRVLQLEGDQLVGFGGEQRTDRKQVGIDKTVVVRVKRQRAVRVDHADDRDVSERRIAKRFVELEVSQGNPRRSTAEKVGRCVLLCGQDRGGNRRTRRKVVADPQLEGHVEAAAVPGWTRSDSLGGTGSFAATTDGKAGLAAPGVADHADAGDRAEHVDLHTTSDVFRVEADRVGVVKGGE